MIHYFRLIRLPNLVVIALTLYLMRICIIGPLVEIIHFELQMSNLNFFLLVFSTILIAAAGYIINDYFDTKLDRDNKPEKIVVGRVIKRRVAMVMHICFNSLGILIGVYLAYKVQRLELALINPICAAALWYYSTSFKHKLLVGNVVIALLAGLVPLIVGLYELPLLNIKYHQELAEMGATLNLIVAWVSAYAIFAFLTTLIREIIKDMEDIEGDRNFGSVTLPIKLGMDKAKWIVLSLSAIVLVLLGYVQFNFMYDLKTAIYFFLLIHLPLLMQCYKTVTGKHRSDFHTASSLMKVIMIAGVMYSLLVYYILINEHQH